MIQIKTYGLPEGEPKRKLVFGLILREINEDLLDKNLEHHIENERRADWVFRPLA